MSIASGPKYLSGARYFLHDLYPTFDDNHSSPLVQATIWGSKNIHADPVHCKQPLCLNHLSAFLDTAWHSQNYDGLLFVTIMSCVMNSFLLLQHAEHAFTYSFSSMIYMCLPQGRHAFFLTFTSPSTLYFTCVRLKANTFLYLFKPVVRQLYSLAFH